MANKDEEIIGLLSRMREEQLEARAENTKLFADLDKKVDLHIQKTEYELKSIHAQDARQNELLDQHIAGVNTLKAIHDEHVKENNIRFSKIEEPRKIIKGITKLVVWLGGIGTAVVAILEMIRFLKGL